MKIDYKNKLVVYMTENKFNQWCMQATLARKRLLQLLKIDTWDQIKDIFDSEDYLLKFFTYKVLTRRYMPAFGFDGDRTFLENFRPLSNRHLLHHGKLVSNYTMYLSPIHV